MARGPGAIDEQDLERALLRKSVGALEGGRQMCADCGRTPLIGEMLYRYAHSATVCELCRPLRRGEPEASSPVRHSEYGHAVRIRRADAA
jgi:hypothetical protein